jgi:hypothetical protein
MLQAILPSHDFLIRVFGTRTDAGEQRTLLELSTLRSCAGPTNGCIGCNAPGGILASEGSINARKSAACHPTPEGTLRTLRGNRAAGRSARHAAGNTCYSFLRGHDL